MSFVREVPSLPIILKFDLPNRIICISCPISFSTLLSTFPPLHGLTIRSMYNVRKTQVETHLLIVSLHNVNLGYTVFYKSPVFSVSSHVGDI